MSSKRFATSRARTWHEPPGSRHWLAAAAVAALMVLPTRGDAAPLNVISKVAVKEQGSNTVVRLRCASKPMFSVFKLERPPRLTLDLANAKLSHVNPLIDVDSWAVSQIATTQFRTSATTIARVMINFRRRAHYTVRSEGRHVVVTVMPHKARPITASGKRSAAAIAQARKEAAQARKEAQRAARSASRAQADLDRLAQEAAKARKQALQARNQANSAKSKMAKLSKEARKRTRSVELRAERLAKLVERARRAAETSQAKARQSNARMRQLAQQAGQATGKAKRFAAEASRARSDAHRARQDADQARRETAKARKLIAQLRKEAGQARASAAMERRKAERQTRALIAAKHAIGTHSRALEAAQRARTGLQQQLATARRQAQRRQQQAETLGRAVARARKLARSGQDRKASAQLKKAERQLALAKAAAARSEQARARVAQALDRAESRARRADQARRRAETARRSAEAARVSAEQSRRLALAARSQAERQRRVALVTLKKEQARRRAAEAARLEASRRAKALSMAVAKVDARQRRVTAAEGRVAQLERALRVAQGRERVQRQRVAQVQASLSTMKLRASRAERMKRQLSVDVQQARQAERQQAKALVGLRKELVSYRGRAAKALATVARLRRLRDAAKRRVAAKQGAERRRAAAALAQTERRLAKAELAERRAQSAHRVVSRKVADASVRQRKLSARLRNTKKDLSDASQRLRRVERRVQLASQELGSARSSLSRVAQRRKAEERARRVAQTQRRGEEKRLQAAKVARLAAERARGAAYAQLGKLQGELAQIRHTRKAEEARLARLRRSQRAAKAQLAALGRKKAQRDTQLDSLGAKLRQRKAKLAALKKQWKKPKVHAAASIRNISFADKADRAEVQIRIHGKAKAKVHRQGQQLVLAIDGAQLPRLLQRTLDTSAFKGPVSSISSFVTNRAGDRVYVKVDTQGKPSQRLERRGDLLVWRFDKPAPSSARFAAAVKTVGKRKRPAPAGGARGRLAREGATDRPKSKTLEGDTYAYKTVRVAGARSRATRRFRRRRYYGRRIDLDFKDADIHNILRLLSQVGSVNIVTSDDVKGKVTIRMRNVPWDQAMDVILRAKGLGQVREGNLVRVAPMADLEKEREAEIARRKQLAQLRPLETRLIPLSYADAQKVLPKLRYTLSPRGKLTFDGRTNMVIARDVGANLNLLEKMIRNLDTQTPQVMIEARIIEARSNYTKELGVQWGGTFQASAANGNSTGLVFPNQIGIGGGATDQLTPSNGLLFGQQANPNFAVNLPATTGLNSGGAIGLTLGSISGAFNINLRLSAAETKGDIRIVSAPRITTLDNVEASIEQGVTIPYSQVSAAGTQTIFKDAKLNLTVKPHVTADGSVVMKVSVQRNEVDFVNTGARGQPTILKKEAKTEMLVKDGDTAVIGGIYTTRDGRSWQKVPWFADIPIIGWFFKNRRDTSDREEVLVFITPRIINRAQSIGR